MRAKAATLRDTKPIRRVALVTYPGLSIFEFSVACEIFGAGLLPPAPRLYEFAVCGEQNRVRFELGLSIDVPRRLSWLRTAHTVVVPPTERPEQVSQPTLRAIRAAHARGARVLSLCTGALVLARAGLLDGRRAVTHWAECATLAAQFPAVRVDPGVLYIDDGDILTSAGSAASIDLCLHVVLVDHGAALAAELARELVVSPHRDGGQAQYIQTPMPRRADPDLFRGALRWLDDHLDAPVTVAALADRAAMSPRSFARHFVAATGATPYQWLLRRRVQRAQELLETSDLSVDALAARVGLGDAANLRKHFHRQVGTSPQAYRRAFGARERAS